MKLLLWVTITFISTTIYAENHSLSVSDGIYTDKVDLKWDPIPEAEYYTIQRFYNTPKYTKLGKKAVLETNLLVTQTNSTSYVDQSIPFGQYSYIVTAYRTNISPKDESKRERKKREKKGRKLGQEIPIPIITNIVSIGQMIDSGHRQATDAEFFLEFQKTIDSSLPRIRTMKMLNFFGEKKKGWREGQLIYKTTGIIRKPFRVTISYKDFVDQSLSLNGIYEVQIFKLFAQKGKLVGTFHVDGIYKGTVTHDLIIDKGQSVGGVYIVQQGGKPEVSLPWDITIHPLDDSQYEAALKGSLEVADKEESPEEDKESLEKNKKEEETQEPPKKGKEEEAKESLEEEK